MYLFIISISDYLARYLKGTKMAFKNTSSCSYEMDQIFENSGFYWTQKYENNLAEWFYQIAFSN